MPMPDDEDDDIDAWKDVAPAPELLDSATLGCIETLRRKRVCLYPGPHLPVQPGDLTDFGQCLGYLGNCNALIFCAPHHGKEEARAKVQHYLHGGDPALVFDVHECVGTDDDWIRKDDLLFPGKAENLLISPPVGNAEPEEARPPGYQFWAHYVVLSIVGCEDKLHVLQIGLRGGHAWLYFLQAHGIRVARTIANPP